MPTKRQTVNTSQFIDRFVHILWLIPGIVFGVAIVGSVLGRTIVDTQVQLSPEHTESLSIPPIQLRRQAIGALRVDVEASLPTNRWLTYEIQLIDREGNVVASAIKQAWAESGTWYEDGQRGTWSERDVWGGLDIRSDEAETLTLGIEILDYTDTSGTEIVDSPVTFSVRVREGAVDMRYLWPGFFITAIFAGVGTASVRGIQKLVVDELINDSDVSGGGVLGGRDRLVTVSVKIDSDENSPASLNVLLTIENSDETEVYNHTHRVSIRRIRREDEISGSGHLRELFILEPKGPYYFYVEVTPDYSVDRTTLRVLETAQTSNKVTVTRITTVS